MAITIIVVSSYVDSTIHEYQVDATFHLFRTLEELDNYIEMTPLRANELFFTKEVLPNVNTSLNYFTSMLENPFLRVDKVTYITDVNSKEIASVEYIIDAKKYDNWEIVEGHLTREYVAGIINGVLRTDVMNPKRKAVYRTPKEAYVRERLRSKDSLEEEYVDDDHQLAGIPDVRFPEEVYAEKESICEIIKVVGNTCDERTVFAFLFAQYMSFSGKTLILESDKQYHTLTELATKASPDFMALVEVKDLIINPAETLQRISSSTAKLIVVGCIDSVDYTYSFILNLLYNNLISNVRYIISEMDFDECPSTEKYILTFPSNIIGILKMTERLDTSTLHNATLVGVDINQLPELVIDNTQVVNTILQDVLEVADIKVRLINVQSLKIGGTSTYDLRSIIEN